MEPLTGPSGSVLPQLLRKKRPRKPEELANSEPSIGVVGNDVDKSSRQSQVGSLSKTEAAIRSNRVFGCGELEDLSLKITAAMIDIQKQVYRGEEQYYEDTYAHGSLFRGWDAFVDSKDVGAAGATAAPQPTTRRVPADLRWFSGSCRSVSRNARPALLRSFSHSRPSSVSQPDSTSASPYPRSETNTPTAAVLNPSAAVNAESIAKKQALDKKSQLATATVSSSQSLPAASAQTVAGTRNPQQEKGAPADSSGKKRKAEHDGNKQPTKYSAGVSNKAPGADDKK